MGKGGEFVRGRGRLVGADVVAVGDDRFRASRGIVIAVGAAAVVPPIDGLAGTPFWTNREILEAETLPESLAILGGGAIGVELAQASSRFGVKVTVIEGAQRLVPVEEPEAGDTLAEVFAKEGVDTKLGARAERVSHNGAEFTVHLSDASDVVADKLLVSVGRVPKLGDLGVEHAGLDPNMKAIPVDGQMRAAPKLWAVGDCTGKGAFTHVAMYQASIATASILGGKEKPDAAYHALPRVTFTDPEIGSVGLSEKAAREAGINVRIGFATVSSSTRGWIHGPGNDGFHKVIEDADRGVLVGATSMGPWGGEVMSFLALAVQAEIPVSTMLNMIYAYPTFYRGIEQALKDLHDN